MQEEALFSCLVPPLAAGKRRRALEIKSTSVKEDGGRVTAVSAKEIRIDL